MKVGVIGAGYWGRKHVEEYCNLGVKLLVSDLNKKNLEYCKEKFGVETTYNYFDILKDSNIESVSICTPSETHYKIAMDCLNAGKNILVEKPIAITVKEGIEIVKLAENKKLLLVVGHLFRFNNAINKVKTMIDNGEIGEIYILKMKWANAEYVTQPDFYDRVSDRDVIDDLILHPFDIINYFFLKDPDEFSCVGNAFRRDCGEDAVFVNCRLNKKIINIELSWITPPKERLLVVVGSEKTAFVDCINQKIDIWDGGKINNLKIDPNNTIRTELNDFLECVKNKTVSVADGYVGVNALKMMEIVKKSLREKKTIRFE